MDLSNHSLSTEWNYSKNNHLNISNVKTKYKIHWICSKGHQWKSFLNNRYYSGSNCPICSRKRGTGSEYLKNSSILNEWDYLKNKILPTDDNINSTLKVWWICSKGHEWKASIYNRCKAKTNCPICNNGGSSYPENVICYYLKNNNINVEHRYNLFGFEVDIYLKDINVAIEYDGFYWHNSSKKRGLDIDKSKKLKEEDIYLIRIREYGLNKISNSFNIMRDSNLDNLLHNDISKLFEHLNQKYNLSIPLNINLEKDNLNILELSNSNKLNNSLSIKNPKLAKEWNHSKNGNLKPENFNPNSHRKAWWICDKKHEWEAQIKSRNLNGRGCPYCNNRLSTPTNNFEFFYKELCKEWNYERNEILPNQLLPNSNKKVWWKCPDGHEWIAQLNNRGSKKSGCPTCYKLKSKKLL